MSDETANLTVSDFLLARIADDERITNRSEGPWLDHYGDGLDHMSPARVLAECEAKRRIVERAAALSEWDEMGSSTADDGDFILATLALPYADHPDYRPEWRA